MSFHRRQRFVHGVVGWLLATACALVLLDALSLELFFVVAFIGVLVLIELVTPVSVTPRWQRRLRWLVVLGLLVFGYIVVRRILRILPESVV
jgi:hypothetical protein